MEQFDAQAKLNGELQKGLITQEQYVQLLNRNLDLIDQQKLKLGDWINIYGRGGNDTVIGAENRRPQPADPFNRMHLTMTRHSHGTALRGANSLGMSLHPLAWRPCMGLRCINIGSRPVG